MNERYWRTMCVDEETEKGNNNGHVSEKTEINLYLTELQKQYKRWMNLESKAVCVKADPKFE